MAAVVNLIHLVTFTIAIQVINFIPKMSLKMKINAKEKY